MIHTNFLKNCILLKHMIICSILKQLWKDSAFPATDQGMRWQILYEHYLFNCSIKDGWWWVGCWKNRETGELYCWYSQSILPMVHPCSLETTLAEKKIFLILCQNKRRGLSCDDNDRFFYTLRCADISFSLLVINNSVS